MAKLSLKSKINIEQRLKDKEVTIAVGDRGTACLSRCYILMGLPGAGKSHWVDSVLRSWKGVYPVLLCEDDLIAEECRNSGDSYADVLARTSKSEMKRQIMERFHQALGVRRDIIVDQLNLTQEDRAEFLTRIPDSYQRIGIIFNTPRNILIDRLTRRMEETGRPYSVQVLTTMLNRFEKPDRLEFHRTTDIDHHCVY